MTFLDTAISSITQLIASSNGTVPVTQLTPVLDALLEARALPPPQVIVKYKGREIVVSRKFLQSTTLPYLYYCLKLKLGMEPLPNETTVKRWESRIQNTVEYVPLTLYATFLHGSSADGVYREIWEEAFQDLVPNIDKLQLVKTTEYDTEIRKRVNEGRAAREKSMILPLKTIKKSDTNLIGQEEQEAYYELKR
ncbi:hypothetical protein M422DRAFT_238867 [Sphaerobolus stellatus SS14]|nr:hypothetical protein M422DRAFT_238867 [Sphaerobolus stellatus SS14]